MLLPGTSSDFPCVPHPIPSPWLPLQELYPCWPALVLTPTSLPSHPWYPGRPLLSWAHNKNTGQCRRERLLRESRTPGTLELQSSGTALTLQHGCLALPGRPEGGCSQSQADKLAFVNTKLMLCRRFVCQKHPCVLLFHPEIKRSFISCLLTGIWGLWRVLLLPRREGA